MKAGGPLLAVLAWLALGAQLSSASQAKTGYCYNVAPFGDVFDEKDCSACLKNNSCSTCANDAQCPGNQKCCPGDCGYICQEAVLNLCHLPSVCGNCKAMFSRYFYNNSTQKCEQFVYGGCGGNKNNFETEDECSSICAPSGTA
ncbi:eppin-like [Eublepharis macularius]|uniref:Eppin-like n=1 Tax=Eublepharis macularius TaxID=481883 RepID=A0AA97L036_EUBMA|nr:eppin-like [Eublepharis macularius]